MAVDKHNDLTKQDTVKQLKDKNNRLVFKLLLFVAGSVLFAVAMVPLYNVMCSLTGFKTGNTMDAIGEKARVDTSRYVIVQFTGNVMSGLGWNFYPKQSSIKVHPGEIATVLFEAKNITSETVAGQAIPSITPSKASIYLKKIECFCFTQQSLKAGETKEMPLRFFVSPDLPSDIPEMTLSYSFFSAVKK